MKGNVFHNRLKTFFENTNTNVDFSHVALSFSFLPIPDLQVRLQSFNFGGVLYSNSLTTFQEENPNKLNIGVFENRFY